MKMTKLILVAVATMLTATAVKAEHEYHWSMNDRFTYAHEGELYLPNEFSLDTFATYASAERHIGKIFEHDIRHGTWGGGIGLNYFFTKWAGISADMEMLDNGRQFVDSATANLVLRAPFDVAHVAPYIFGGGGGQFDPSSQWQADGGVGVDFRINHWTGIFTDVRYVWTENNGDYALFRAGLRWAF